AEQATIALEDLADLTKIYNPDLINKNQLIGNINELLQIKDQVSLLEVITTKGLSEKNGLAELLTYVTLVNTNSKYFINNEIREAILFDHTNKKYLDLPQIIFTKYQ